MDYFHFWLCPCEHCRLVYIAIFYTGAKFTITFKVQFSSTTDDNIAETFTEHIMTTEKPQVEVYKYEYRDDD